MRWRYKLAFSVPIIGAAAVLAAVPVAPAFGARASVTTAAQTAALATSAVPTPTGTPVFSATFTGTHLNTKLWATCYWWNPHGGCKNFNGLEWQWYLPSQDRVWGGVLRLVAQRQRTVGTTSTGAPAVYGCRSGMITSNPGFNFKYGFVQVVAKVPHAAGLWPALWLAATSRTSPAEMDMIESWGVNHEEAAFFHPVGLSWRKGSIPLSLTQGWQTYSLRWTYSKVTFYVGSRIVLTVTKGVPHQRMYFIANVAEYLRPTLGRCSGTMLIKSVKVWQ